MKPKDLIKEKEKGCGLKMSLGSPTCEKDCLCDDCELELKALKQMNKLWLNRIDKKIKAYEKYWLDARKEGDKQAEDIFYNTYSNLEELKSQEVKNESNKN